MHLKREFKREAFASRIFKTLRNYTLPVIFGFFLLALTANTASAEPTTTQQQTVRISGKIVDSSGEPLIGASVVEKGTSNGTATDVDGNFTMTVNPDATIEVRYIGFLPYSFKVTSGRNVYNVSLKEDSKSLEEVIVVGYGVQKKKLVTGATVQVGGNDLQKQNTVSVFSAMQSQTPGVNIIQNSGQPGSGFNVNIRGMGTINKFAPLYVIDGVAGGDINQLNPADIESMDVLKDAASAAIYGARAANGVILVTTKQGKEGKIQISYDGYLGVQNVYKMLPLLNAQQYAAVNDEISFNAGTAPNNWQNLLGPYYQGFSDGTWTGTNWLEEARVKNAPIQNHAFNMIGGNSVSRYSMGVSFAKQEGIFGAPAQSNYQRTTARMNSDHSVLKARDFDVIKIGENINYSYTMNSGIATSNMYVNDLANLIRAMPIMPMYNDAGEYFNYADAQAMGIGAYAPYASNPIARMLYTHGYNTSKNHHLNMAVNLQIQPIKNLIFKSQIGYGMDASSYRSFTPAYTNLSVTDANAKSNVNQSADVGWKWSWTNTLNYIFKLDKNHFDVMVGQEASQYGLGEHVQAQSQPLLYLDWQHAYVDNTKADQVSDITIYGSPWGQGGISSFFGRINYDWNETYMLSLIARYDGSSNFAKGHRWGTFPSVSAGWVITNEPSMESAKTWLDFLKLRASWGENGNQDIPNFNYIAKITLGTGSANGSNYRFGNDMNTTSLGGFPANIANPVVTWEKSNQTDIGLDARFLNSRLSLAFDWYIKKTIGWLVQAPILASYGVPASGAPYINGGDIKNQGMEVALGWNDHAGNDFTYGINANLSYNTNKVTRIANSEGIIHGRGSVLSESTGEMSRVQVGYPVGYFWGFKTAGVFQNQADIDAWKAEGNGFMQGNPRPGDLKFVDLDHNGVIDNKDKTMIGDPNPKYHVGLNLNFGYKGFDLSMAMYGALGFQIAQSYRSFGDSQWQNFTTDIFNRWHGEGTSDTYPRLTTGNQANYINISDIYIHKGDYLKCQNLTLGYDFKKLAPKMPLGEARLYVQAQNLFTITGYNGMDPEIGDAIGDGNYPWMKNVDIGFYPSPRTYLVGLSLKF